MKSFNDWDYEMEQKRMEWEINDARICAICGRATDYPFYNVWPDDRGGVVCSECFDSQMKKARGILNGVFLDAIDVALTEFYERRS